MSLRNPQVQDPKSVNQLHKFRFDQYFPPVIFQGVTENATPTEIFIDNQPNFRLELPENSVLMATWIGAAFNTTAGVGTVQGNVAAGQGSFSAIRASTTFVLNGAATGTAFVFTANDTLDQMVCTVTGVAAARIVWKCEVKIVAASMWDLDNIANGNFTGIAH